MHAEFDQLLPMIISENDSGLTLGKIKAKFIGKSKAKANEQQAELEKRLGNLVREGAIWGPLKQGSSHYYFASGRGPSIETASKKIEQLVRQSGIKLLSKVGLEKKVTGKEKQFFVDGIKHAVANRRIVELACGSSKYYLHCDTAAEYFNFEASADDPGKPPILPANETKALTFEDILPVYHRLKAEQGGFSAVKIFDLKKALGCRLEPLHDILIAEAKAGRITIHPTTSVELPPEVIDASIRLPGFAEPFVTFVVEGER